MKTLAIYQSREQKSNISKINTPLGYSKKTRKEINRENYLRHAEERKEQARLRFTKKKEREQKQVGKYSQAADYQVLMSLKEYTELNSAKHKKWLDFVWTFKSFISKEGEPLFSNVIEIMRLRELAENLINDYWETAKSEVKKGKSWNSLNQEKKDRLVKYLARQKARREQGIKEAVEELEVGELEKELELAKFHEERGKVNCVCYECEGKKKVQSEIKSKLEKETVKNFSAKGECCVCSRVRKLGEEGVCKGCESEIE